MGGEMACLRVESWGEELQRATVPVPPVGPADVLVEIEATGVGRTVHKYVSGRMRARDAYLPRIPGHELVGTVVETGDGVDHPAEGDRVTAYFHIGCGHCRFCHDGLDPLCADHRGHVGVAIDGGFADYVRLPARLAIELPDGFDPVSATAIPDAIATPYHVATRRAGIEPGDRVAVLGAGGGVGIHMVQMGRYFGGDVIAVDLDGEKLDRCRTLGAEDTLEVSERTPADAFGSSAAKFDVVIDCTGATDLIEAAFERLGPRGRLVHLASAGGSGVRIPPGRQVRGETAVLGSRYCTRGELRAAAELVADGTIEPVVSSVVGFDGVERLLETIVGNRLVGRGAMTPE